MYPARRGTPANIAHTANSRVLGKKTARSNLRDRIARITDRWSAIPDMPGLTEKAIISSIHEKPSKKPARWRLTKIEMCASGNDLRIARRAGRLMTRSPSQLQTATRIFLGDGERGNFMSTFLRVSPGSRLVDPSRVAFCRGPLCSARLGEPGAGCGEGTHLRASLPDNRVRVQGYPPFPPLYGVPSRLYGVPSRCLGAHAFGQQASCA